MVNAMVERALFIVTLACGAALGIFWPLHKEAPIEAQPAGIEVTLERSSDHHFYADVRVNGHSVRFLVDTGASEIALTEEDARSVGIAVDPSKYQLVGEGASGIVRGQYVELGDVAIGAIRQSNAKAVVVQGATVSLLGQPFLENVDEIVIRKGEMVLRDQKDS